MFTTSSYAPPIVMVASHSGKQFRLRFQSQLVEPSLSKMPISIVELEQRSSINNEQNHKLHTTTDTILPKLILCGCTEKSNSTYVVAKNHPVVSIHTSPSRVSSCQVEQ